VKKLETEFLYNEPWTVDTERLLFQRVQELLSLVRNDGISLSLHIELNVRNPEEAMFLINKKINKINQVTINNQKLSLREIEILGLIMLGYTGNQIADKLCISFETVKSHRKHILEKTGAKNTVALVSYYHQTFFEK
jgi:DNA-binding NarL/FixJ family response regulator